MVSEIPAVMNPTVLQTSRGPLEYTSSGDGPVVLALHGAMGGYDQAHLLARTVAEPGYRFLALSRPGYLGSPINLGRTPEEQADLYAEMLDVLGIRRAAVIAISGGGPSAMHFALRHPDRCWGLVLISTSGSKVESKLPFAFHLMRVTAHIGPLVNLMRRKASEDLEASVARSISDPATLKRVMADPIVRPMLEELTLCGFHRMAQRMDGTVNDVYVTRSRTYPLEEITVPTLVVHGDSDPLVPFEQHGRVLAERIPGAELLCAKGGEHVTIFTHRDEVRPRVTQFLRERAPAVNG